MTNASVILAPQKGQINVWILIIDLCVNAALDIQELFVILILMIALALHVVMELLVEMESTDSHALVLQDGRELVVRKISVLVEVYLAIMMLTASIYSKITSVSVLLELMAKLVKLPLKDVSAILACMVANAKIMAQDSTALALRTSLV